MTDKNTNAEVAENAETESSESPAPASVFIKRGNAILELDGITEGAYAGFKFWRPTFESLDDCIEHFTAISKTGKDGAEVVLSLVNAALAARHRSLANSKLTIPQKIKNDVAKVKEFVDERNSKLTSPNVDDRILISQDDAFEYIPGERDVDSLSGLNNQKVKLFKAANETKKQYNEAIKLNNQELAARLKNEVKLQVGKYQEICIKIKEKEEQEQTSILELVED